MADRSSRGETQVDIYDIGGEIFGYCRYIVILASLVLFFLFF